MQTKQNYQRMLDKLLENPANHGKRLLLHSCCAPCSSYVLVYLSSYFQITVLYFNPNISQLTEYNKRVAEQKRLIEALNQRKETVYPISIIEGDYEPRSFLDLTKGYEECPEGGERCFLCYEMRLRETARLAREGQYDYFTTTLTISPLKKADKLNEIGGLLSGEYGVPYLFSDFKKKNGYLTSIALSKEYDLYRQDYCGCVYSKAERERQKAAGNCGRECESDNSDFNSEI